MPNEQKAQQIMGCNRANCFDCGGSLSVDNGCTEFVRIMAMAQWKDEQMKEALNNILIECDACFDEQTTNTLESIIKHQINLL